MKNRRERDRDRRQTDRPTDLVCEWRSSGATPPVALEKVRRVRRDGATAQAASCVLSPERSEQYHTRVYLTTVVRPF